jgi:hypothetical protein
MKECKVQDFFRIDVYSGMVIFKERRECFKPNVLSKIKRAVNNQELSFLSFFQVHLNNNNRESATLYADVDCDPFVKRIKHVFLLHNKNLRRQMMDTECLYLASNYNGTISRKRWKLFYRSKMHYSPRNFWYRLIHKKLPSRTRMYNMNLDWIETDQCMFCLQLEDDKHMLFLVNIKLIFGTRCSKYVLDHQNKSIYINSVVILQRSTWIYTPY